MKPRGQSPARRSSHVSCAWNPPALLRETPACLGADLAQHCMGSAQFQLQIDINAAMTDARSRTSAARPITAWQGSQGKGFSRYLDTMFRQDSQGHPFTKLLCVPCSLPGAFAVHGQSVKQTQLRAAAADSGFRNRKLPQVWARFRHVILILQAPKLTCKAACLLSDQAQLVRCAGI